MKNFKYAITLVVAFLLFSCNDEKLETIEVLVEGTEITSFSYFKSNESFILDKIDRHASHLIWAQEENNKKWNTIGLYVWPNPVVYNSYNEEVEHLKKWYSERMNWLETALNNL
jgi:hypothetical protein